MRSLSVRRVELLRVIVGLKGLDANSMAVLIAREAEEHGIAIIDKRCLFYVDYGRMAEEG